MDLAPEDRASLLAFVETSRRVAESRVLTDRGLGFRFAFGPTADPQFAPPADLEELAVRFRPLMLERDSTSFFKVLKVVGKYVRHPGSRRLLRHIRRSWKRAEAGEEMAWTSSVSWAEAKNSWFYGRIFHVQPEKKEHLDEILSDEVWSQLFWMRIQATFDALLTPLDWLTQIIECLLERPTEPETAVVVQPDGGVWLWWLETRAVTPVGPLACPTCSAAGHMVPANTATWKAELDSFAAERGLRLANRFHPSWGLIPALPGFSAIHCRTCRALSIVRTDEVLSARAHDSVFQQALRIHSWIDRGLLVEAPPAVLPDVSK